MSYWGRVTVSIMKHKLFFLAFFVAITFLVLLRAAVAAEKPFSGGIVPDEQTAIAVAEAILFRAYGKKNIEAQKPYKVSLTDGEWYLFGTLPEDPNGPVFGGVFRIVISQKDGRVRSVGHGE
jgi:hypothetical protein